MKSDNRNSVTLTEKRIASAKGLHLICAIVAMVLNVISFVVVAVNVSISEMIFLMFPFALAVLDIIFFVKVILSNYRFAYAVKGAIIHAAVVLVVSAAAYVVMGVLRSSEGIVFVDFAIYAMIAVHVVQSIATAVTALYATKGGKSMRKILGVLFTVVFVAAAGIYGRFLLVEGFFGQGGYGEYRTVVYKYNGDGTYTATDVLGGYGKNVVIPHQFNGKHVSKIDCALFAHEELASVKVDCDHKTGCENVLTFVGAEHLNFINENIQVFAPKGFMDSFRKSLYELSLSGESASASNALTLANHVYPDDIKENEVYVSFGYDAETLRLVGVENIIPVWVKEKGTAFNILEHTGVDYITNSDVDNPKHLYWCHNNLEEKIFKCIADAEGNAISGAVNESVVNAKVTFENLYHVRFVDDADESKWNVDDAEKFMYEIGNDTPVCEYIITTESKIQSKLDAITRRNGFELAFRTGSGENKRELEDIAAEITMLDSAGSRDLYVYLDWNLLPPSIDMLTANGNDGGCTVVYGNDVQLSSAASHAEEKIALKYEWLYNGKVIAEGSGHALENIYPNSATFANTYTKAGEYTLRVTAGNDANTSLTSVTEKKVNVDFEKKELNFVWVLPEGSDAIYSATDKNDIIDDTTFIVDDVINGDNIVFDICHNTATNNKTIGDSPVRNANVAEEKYKLLLKLREGTEAAELYEIVNPDAEFRIEAYAVDVVWNDKVKFEYNGLVQKPETLALAPLGEAVAITVNGGQKDYNVEGYTAMAVTADTNYKLGNTERHFEITKRPITISSWNTKTFAYNGAKQYPRVDKVDNLAEGQLLASISDDIIYADINLGDDPAKLGVYVGTYKVAVSLPEVYNYVFTGSVEQEYNITPVDLTVKIVNKSMVYNGKVYGNDNFTFTFTKTELKGGDEIDEVLSLDYSNSIAASAVNVNDAGYEISADIISGDKFVNYNVTVKNATLTITKRPVAVYITPAEKIYDGQPYPVGNYTFTVQQALGDKGIVDEVSDVFALKYKGNAIDAVDCNTISYVVDADIIEGYKYENYEIEIIQSTLKIKKRPIRVSALSVQKIYDGSAASFAEFSYNVIDVDNVNFFDVVDGEDLGSPVYNCGATTNKNVGSYKIDIVRFTGEDAKNYEISDVENGTYTISKKPATVTISNNQSKEYDGYAPSQFEYELSGVIEEDKSVLGSATYLRTLGNINANNNPNVGQYIVKVTGFSGAVANNYEFTCEENGYEIYKKHITVTIKDSTVTYNGRVPTLNSDNYEIDELANPDKSKTFAPTFKIDGNADYAQNSHIYRNVGSYAVSVELANMDNYNVSYVSGTITIAPMPITIRVQPLGTMYTGKTAKYTYTQPQIAYGDEMKDIGEIVFSTYANDYITPAINVGTYTVKASVTNMGSAYGNYTITLVEATHTISPAKLTVTLNNAEKVYGQATPVFTVKSHSGFVEGESFNTIGNIVFDEALQNKADSGSYTINATLNSATAEQAKAANNYDITINPGTYTINPAPLTVTLGVTGDKIFDGTNNNQSYFTLKVDGLIDESHLAGLGVFTYEGDAVRAVDAGTYTLSASLSAANNNYYVKEYKTCEFTILKKHINVEVQAEDKKYDGKAGANVYTVTSGGLVNNDNLVALGNIVPVYASEAKNVGEYEITVDVDALNASLKNYTVDSCKGSKFKITPAKLTVSVAAEDRVYDGEGNNKFTVSAEGFAGGENLAMLGEAVYTVFQNGVSVPEAIEAGTYTVQVEIKASDTEQAEKLANYELEYVYDTEFVISPAAED